MHPPTGLLPEDSYKHSFPFCRSAFEVGSIIPGTKVLISARRFQPSGCRKRAVSQSKVDFATSAKSPHCGRRAVAPLLPIAPARSSSWARLCSPWAELQYPSDKSRSKVASRPKISPDAAAAAAAQCAHTCRILCEVCEHTDCSSILPAMAGKPSISGVPFWRVF